MKTKPLVIIVEGPDRCGKGTFIESFRNIATTPNIVHLHSTKPPELFAANTLQERASRNRQQKLWSAEYNKGLICNIQCLADALNDIIILDRSYLGEYIYGNLYRSARYSNRDFNDFELDYLPLDDYNFVLVTFVDSPENLLHRDDGKSHSNIIEYKNVEVDRFKELHQLSIIKKKYLIDWSREEFSKILLDELVRSILIEHSIEQDNTCQKKQQ